MPTLLRPAILNSQICPRLTPFTERLATWLVCLVLAAPFAPARADTIDDLPVPPVPAVSAPSVQNLPTEPAPAATPLPASALTAPLELETVKPHQHPVTIDLWERIRRGYKMPDLTGALSDDRTQWYASKPDYMQRMTERSSLYLFHIVTELERRGLPTELALLPFIESAFRPEATSTAAAAGMWQFIPSTGREYKLTQNMFRDDRRHVLASTGAALDYLTKLYNMFGDWHLALAAYNWGEGSVGRAQQRNQRAGLGTSYIDLNMPNETRLYVPKLQAIKNIVGNPTQFNITLPAVPNHAYFETVTVRRDVDVTMAAKLADLPLAEFQSLNPSYKKPVILAASRPEILLPYDNAEVFKRNYARHEGRLASWTATTISQTEKPASIAARYGISEAQLRTINGIPPRMLIKAGSTLVVPRTAVREEDVTQHVADNATLAMAPDAPPLRRASHKVRKGENLAKVAQRYRTTVAMLKSWNRGVSDSPRVGAALVVYVPQRASTSAARSRNGRTVRAPAGRANKASVAKKSSKARTSRAAPRTRQR